MKVEYVDGDIVIRIRLSAKAGDIVIRIRLSAKAVANWLLYNVWWDEPKDPERIGEWQRLYQTIKTMAGMS